MAGLCAILDPNNQEISLGLEMGSIHVAESLLLARYFMFTQVYFHRVRRAYDLHLKEFLQQCLDGGKFTDRWKDLLETTDDEVNYQIRLAASDRQNRLHEFATPLLHRKHFRTIYEQMSTDKQRRPTILDDLASFATEAFGPENVRMDSYPPKRERNDFWVAAENRPLASSLEVSEAIRNLPPVEFGFLFIAPELAEKAAPKIEHKLKILLSEGESDYCI